MDDEHIEMIPELREQLEDDGLYGESVVSGIVPSSVAQLPISMKWLPIFGSSNRYQTKWICNFYDTCFERDLKDRAMKLAVRLDIDKIK